MIDTEVDGGNLWILQRIKDLEKLHQERLAHGIDDNSRWATHRNIWQGSYDVWETKQDQIDAVEIPKARMKACAEAGLIKSEIKRWRKWDYEVWSLTDAGKIQLENSK